ncbi:MAG TPA: cation:proton antiporter [Bacteroidales bacterium]|nr:cation:proton antiporter [Bacteroidales bacterium]
MPHLPALILDLAIILGAAAVVTLLFKKLKQPVVLGYIIAGVLVGPNIKLFGSLVETQSIQTWADIGVIFLLFGLGLDFSFKKLMKVGLSSVITAVVEVLLTLLTGFCLGKLLGWSTMDSLFLGGILSIASTTIIIRAFNELGLKNQKFAGMVKGVLVIEDMVAVLLLALLSTVAVRKSVGGGEVLFSMLKLAFFMVLWFVSGIFFLPTLLQRIRKLINEETLLIISLALCLLMVVLAAYTGFSPAMGAFIMGSILAETTKGAKIEHITESVKNLFGAVFFVSIGMLLDLNMLGEYLLPVIAATLVLLLGKPLFVAAGAIISGQPLNIALRSGMSLSQIGEFSFIIATLGLTLKVTSGFLYPIAVAVSVLTTFFTPYMMRFSEPVYKFLAATLPEKWIRAIEKYSLSTRDISEISDWKKVLSASFLSITIFSVIIITIIIVSTRYIEPLFYTFQFSRVITATVTLFVLSPFLWALAFRRTQRQAYANVWQRAQSRGPLLALLLSRMVLAVIYVGLLFYLLFSTGIALIGMLGALLLLAVFSKKIKNFYRKIETRFMINLNECNTIKNDSDNVLTAWDIHIGSLEIKEHSPLAGNTLSEAKIREKFGVNVVMIVRDDLYINVPDRETRLFPHDILSVIGTDEQIEQFGAFLENVSADMTLLSSRPKVSLHHFTVGPESVLLNINMRQSKIREKTHSLVVGIERDGQRLLNPEPDEVIRLNDKIWIVGDEQRIKVCLPEFIGA